MKEGALPTINLPEKSWPRKETVRSTAAIEKKELVTALATTTSLESSNCFKDFSEFIKRAKLLKLSKWKLTIYGRNNSCIEELWVEFSEIPGEYLIPRI